MKIKKVVIIGVGLIGGSIGKALIKKDSEIEVVGVCRRAVSLEKALKEKAISRGTVGELGEAVKGADIVIICTPVNTIKNAMDELAKVAEDKKLIVTDAGSTKEDLVRYANKYKDKFIFVGSHPLAGAEKTGVEFADRDLFKNAVCIVTKTSESNENDIKFVKTFWENIGLSVEIMDAPSHDTILAYTSHLPHVVAYALSGLQDSNFLKYASSGFKDTTRIASSDPNLWKDIFMTNKNNMVSSIDELIKELERIKNAIGNGQDEELLEILERCKKVRDGAGE